MTSVLRTGDALPTQTGNSGKFLGTNGTSASWQTVDALPAQTGAAGKYLTTDGTDAAWETVPASGPPGPFVVRCEYATAGLSSSQRAVEIDEDGNTYIGFALYPGVSQEYAGVCKVSASGEIVWRASWGGTSTASPRRVDDIAVGDGYVYVLDFNTDTFDHYVTALNAYDGSFAWSRQMPFGVDQIVANNHGHVMVVDQNMAKVTIFTSGALDMKEWTVTCPSDALGYGYSFASKSGDFYLLAVNDAGTPELWRILPNGSPVLVTADVGNPTEGVYEVSIGGDDRLYVRQWATTPYLNVIDLETGESRSYIQLTAAGGNYVSDPSGGVVKYEVVGGYVRFVRISDRGMSSANMLWRTATDNTLDTAISLFDEAGNRSTTWSPRSIALRAGYNNANTDECGIVLVFPLNLAKTMSDATIAGFGYVVVVDDFSVPTVGDYVTAPTGGTSSHVFTESPTYATYIDANPTVTLNDTTTFPLAVTALTTGPIV